MRRALVTGISGQDGSYLAELLLRKGYEVHGIVRRASTFNTARLDGIYQDPHEPQPRLQLHYGDLTDSVALVNLIREISPDEVYHLGAQSHVKVSFEIPEYTGESTGLGTTRLLEAIRASGVETRFYQASSSEMFGAAPPPLRLRQGLRLLGHGELPGGVRPVRGQRHPVQPREPAPRRDLRPPHDHPGRGPHPRRPAGAAVPRQPAGPPRLGLRARVRRGDVADAAAGPARRLRDRHRREPQRAGVLRGGLRPRRPGVAPPRAGRPVVLPARRGRRAARRGQQGPPGAGLEAADRLRRAGPADGRRRHPPARRRAGRPHRASGPLVTAPLAQANSLPGPSGGLARAQPGPGCDIACSVEISIHAAVGRADHGVLPWPSAARATAMAGDARPLRVHLDNSPSGSFRLGDEDQEELAPASIEDA